MTQLDEREEQLMTIIDFCNEMASDIRGDWTDPRTQCRAIWDAHDLAHVLLGGDRTRSWTYLRAMLQPVPDYAPTPAWTDVRMRMATLLKEMEWPAQERATQR
jgi:hypothetical protein